MLTFKQLRDANVQRCMIWHPKGIRTWSASDWLTAVCGELGELASLIKMSNRERDGLVGNKFTVEKRQIANEIADVAIYLDLLAAAHDISLDECITAKFNEVSKRNEFDITL